MVTIRASGAWRRGAVTIRWTESTWSAPHDVIPMIDAAWNRAAARPGVILFDGPMCRLESWRATPQSLELTLSRTSYRIFLGTNLSHPELADRHGEEVLANPVGLSALVETSDGWLLLGRRSPRVAYYPSRTHPFAGALEPADDLDVFDDMMRELNEELGFTSDDVLDLTCRGLVQDATLRQPELIFHAVTRRTRAQVEDDLDTHEHHDVTAIRATREGAERALTDPDLTPVAVGALSLYRATTRG